MTDSTLTFQRFEYKYQLTPEQFSAFMPVLRPHLVHDQFYESTVCSIYYDTPDFLLIRRSVEGPVYKEKLRLRSYGIPTTGSEVFVEIKQKYDGIVYKRRTGMNNAQAEAWLSGQGHPPIENQITREIDRLLTLYSLAPRVLIACDRKAYISKENSELRFTFDRNIRWRTSGLHLPSGDTGSPVFPDDTVLMELKLPGSAPLWLAHLLSEYHIYPSGFSKYGRCYNDNLYQQVLYGAHSHV